MFGRKPSARPPAQLGYTPPPAPVAVTPGTAHHILALIREHERSVRRECALGQFYTPNVADQMVRAAQEQQRTYFAQIERLLKGQP